MRFFLKPGELEEWVEGHSQQEGPGLQFICSAAGYTPPLLERIERRLKVSPESSTWTPEPGLAGVPPSTAAPLAGM